MSCWNATWLILLHQLLTCWIKTPALLPHSSLLMLWHRCKHISRIFFFGQICIVLTLLNIRVIISTEKENISTTLPLVRAFYWIIRGAISPFSNNCEEIHPVEVEEMSVCLIKVHQSQWTSEEIAEATKTGLRTFQPVLKKLKGLWNNNY